MSISKSSIDKFTFFWQIKNPQYCPLSVGKFITGPKTKLPQFSNTEWHLKLYPHGETEKSKEHTSCYILRGQDDGPDTIEMTYYMGLSSGKGVTKSFEKGKGWGYSSFLPYSLSAYEETIVIVCEMQSKLDNLTIKEEKYSSRENEQTFPVKYFSETKFLCEKKSIQTFIDSLISGTCSRMMIPVVLPEPYPSLMMSLENNSGEVIDLNVRLTNGVFKDAVIVTCEMSIKNNAEQLMYSLVDNHIFIAGQDEKWCLTKQIDKSHFKVLLSDTLSNEILLKGEFTISIGQTHSEILSMERISGKRNFVPSNKYELTNQMFRFYKEKKLCDFVLQVGNETINVHKVVLSAVSPVFAAMFTNDSLEKKSNILDIVDADKEAVEDMISFVYTGSVKELEYESAKKLFTLGHAYQISLLLDLVRNIFISLINRDTVCGLLSIADTYKDKHLESEAMKFLKLNKDAILDSPEWENFVKEYPHLAAKSLRKACLLNKRKRNEDRPLPSLELTTPKPPPISTLTSGHKGLIFSNLSSFIRAKVYHWLSSSQKP